MSRGTSKPKVVDAVLGGLTASEGGADHYAIAESLIRHAQPCRVDVGLGLADAASRRSRVDYEVRVMGLTGGLRATVISATDTKPVAIAAGLKQLKGALRRRGEPDAYRILALRLNGNGQDIEKLRQAVADELGARAQQAEVVAGQGYEFDGKAFTPVAVVVSPPA